MKPAPFKYTAPPTLAAALNVLADNVDEAKLLAGGQSLIPAMNFRLIQPAMLIDLNGLHELDYIRQGAGGVLRIGAMTRHSTLEGDHLVREHLPLIYEALPHIAHPQIRNRGTIGGSLVHADPAAELPAVLTALKGRILLRNQKRERWVAGDQFYKGLFTMDLEPDEILVEIEFPLATKQSGWSFVEFARRKGDYALMGVAVDLTLDSQGFYQDGTLVYLNAGDTPINALKAAEMLKGEKPSSELFEAVANEAAHDEINPTANIHGSTAYVRHLASVLTRKALRMATERSLKRNLN